MLQILSIIRTTFDRKKKIMGILDVLGFGNKANEVQEYVQKGAVILDVRTPEVV